MYRIALASLCGLLLTSVTTAADPVEVGKPAPDFSMLGIDGEEFKLSEITASGKNVALVFSRAHWCTFCMLQLSQLQKSVEEFEKLNAQLVFVFREEEGGVEGLKKVEAKLKGDAKGKVRLGLDLNKKTSGSYSPDKGTYNCFVIDSKGQVRGEIDGTLIMRAKPEEFVKILKEIESK